MSPGPACAGFIAGTALQLQQPRLRLPSWYWAAVLLACALVGGLLCFGDRMCPSGTGVDLEVRMRVISGTERLKTSDTDQFRA
jgi:hypothetical protein